MIKKNAGWRKNIHEQQSLLDLGKVETYYSDNAGYKDMSLYAKYYMMLAALDYEFSVFHDQQLVLDGLVDLTKIKEEQASLYPSHYSFCKYQVLIMNVFSFSRQPFREAME